MLNRFRCAALMGGLSLLFFPGPASATFQEAADALKEKDYVFALEEFTRLAEKEGDAEARYQLGRMYEQGFGVPRDEIQAFKIFEQAAQDGNSKAALKVGNAYYLGRGVTKNYVDAFNWFRKSAEDGNYSAQYNLGLMYEEGLGVKKDLVKAFKSYQQAGNQGYMPAQAALGRMFVQGVGTPQDYTQAIRWYRLAADQGDVEAQMKLAELFSNTSVRGLPFNLIGAHMYYNLVAAYAPSPKREEAGALRDQLTSKMRHEEVQAAQSRAQKWRKKSREESYPSQNQEGLVEIAEEGKSKRASKPAEGEAAPAREEKKEITVKTELDELIVSSGVSRRDLNRAIRSNNFEQIVKNLTLKANSGDELSMIVLGDLYTLGQGVEQDPQAAHDWYKKAAEKNNSIGLFRLAPMYCEGNPVEPDLANCYKWFLLSKKFANEGSLPTIDEAIKLLDANLDQPIRDEGAKMAEEWGKAAAAPEKPQADKGLISSFKERFFKSSEDELEDDGAIERPAEKADEKSESADDAAIPDL